MSPQAIWAFIFGGGGGFALGFAAFRIVGLKWLDSHFEARLQRLRHEHDQEIESLRFRINTLLDRATKLSAREFEVLPEAWERIVDAHVELSRLLSRARWIAQIDKMPEPDVAPFLEKVGFERHEIDELLSRQPGQRQEYYAERREGHDLQRASAALLEANSYLSKKALFFDEDVYGRLDGFLDFAFDAFKTHENILELKREGAKIPKQMERHDERYRDEGETQKKELERFLRGRFWASNELSAG